MIIDAKFKLKQDLETWRKGRVFDCMGGLVSGVCGIPFTNKEYFEMTYVKYSQDHVFDKPKNKAIELC